MCTTNLQPFRPIPISVQTNSYFRPNPISDQFLFPTNSYFRPISISDQFLFPTNSYSRPVPISDQFLFPTNSYFQPIPIPDQFLFPTMQIVRLAHFQESTASVRPLVETKNKEFQKLSIAASMVWIICISSLSLDADYDTWHTLEKEERPRGVQSLRRQRPCENAALAKF